MFSAEIEERMEKHVELVDLSIVDDRGTKHIFYANNNIVLSWKSDGEQER